MPAQPANLNNGFLPFPDPLEKLPDDFSAWENVANNLRKLLVSDCLRITLESLPPFPTKKLRNETEYERAMLILSFLGHAYIWGCTPLTHKLPKILAQPWFEVAQKLGRPPILSYASYALHNWRRIDKNRSIELGNIALLQNFHGGIDEEWFVLVHVDIEAKATHALQSLIPAQQAALNNDSTSLTKHLHNIADTLEKMCRTLDRMPEHCDPYIYYHRVRPYIHGWKDNPMLPEGLLYEGVEAYKNQPQKFRGETGAQSSIIPALDAILGITHKNDRLSSYLLEMRDYMPPKDRDFLQQIESQKSVRDYVLTHHQQFSELKANYNRCVEWITHFRTTHLRYAALYIHKQSQDSDANSTSVGTGGTPFMEYLKKHKEETLEFLVP